MVAHKKKWCWRNSWELYTDLLAKREMLGLAWAFKTSKKVHPTLPPTRPHLPILSNSATLWWPSICIYEPMGDILTQATTNTYLTHDYLWERHITTVVGNTKRMWKTTTRNRCQEPGWQNSKWISTTKDTSSSTSAPLSQCSTHPEHAIHVWSELTIAFALYTAFFFSAQWSSLPAL